MILLVLLLLLSTISDNHSLEGFFPYGLANNDTQHEVIVSDESVFGPFSLDVPIVIFDRPETTFYVSTNGLISFRSPFGSFVTENFTNSFTRFGDPIVAPYWVDLEPDLAGSIFSRTTGDAGILNKTAALIEDHNPVFSGFQPEQVMIVTWERVAIFGLRSFGPRAISVSFQCVLATDGNVSFAIFIYDDLDLLLSNFEREGLVIGFNEGDRQRFSVIFPASINRTNIYRIDGCIMSLSPDENCTPGSVPLDCNELRATNCFCDQGEYSTTCSVDTFFPFGLTYGDDEVAEVLETLEGPIQLAEPYEFYFTRKRNFFVSTNGFISFESPPDLNRRAFFSSLSIPLIAPLWAEFDFRSTGSVYYRTSQDRMLLERVADIVANENQTWSDFQPTSCVIVTWFQASFISIVSEQTFQVILATDSRATFSIFIYGDPGAITDIATSGIGTVGFDAGQQQRSAAVGGMNDFVFRNLNVFRLDGLCITGAGSTRDCELNTTSLTCGGLEALTCLCRPGLVAEESCELENFFPFGTRFDDVVGPQAVDATTAVISVRSPIVYYMKNQENFFVSTNGLVSFESPFDSHIPTALPRRASPFVPLIAPLWADFNFRDMGTIFYRVSNDSSLLVKATTAIGTNNSVYSEFRPTSAVVVTWFQSNFLRTENLVDFQAVLVTDEELSFAIFLYDHTEDFPQSVHRGFDAGTGGSYQGVTLSSSMGSSIFRIDGHCVPPLSSDICDENSVPFRCEDITTVTEDVTLLNTTVSCLCKEGYTPRENDTCLNYFPFGDRAGDISFIPQPPFVFASESITVPVPMVYERSASNLISISSLGHIFLEDVELPFSINPIAIIAIPEFFVSDLLDMIFGEPTYSVYYRNTSDQSTLAKVVSSITERNSDLAGFQPALAVVVTWILGPFTSVQCILSTDGNVTFAILLYEHPQGHQKIEEYSATTGPLRIPVLLAGSPLMIENVLRIDGCITTISRDDVCALNSVATECAGTTATRCSCIEGYQQVDNLTCIDTNECSVDNLIHDCDQICINTIGGFNCSCENGYTLMNDSKSCGDVDECSLENHNCSQLCINVNGGFSCSCDEGYVLADDNRSCEDINECFEQDPTHNCDQFCNNTDGGFSCSCEEGYVLINDSKCEDINECSVGNPTHDCNQICVNTNGGFNCSCKEGFLLLNDSKSCEESSNSASGVTVEVATGVTFSLLAAIIAVAVIMFAYVYYRRRKRRLLNECRFQSDAGQDEAGKDQRLMNFQNLNYLTVQSALKHSIPKSLIVPSCNLDLQRTIGQGEFGIVYRARRKDSFVSGSSETVAVKTLKGFVERDLIEDLLKECAKMYEFDHPHVLKLSGVCLDGGPAPYIIMPFMANGSLLAYLKEERKKLVLEPNVHPDDDVIVVQKKLLDISIQVAKGMEYLASKRVVHRDLSARNCMIDLNFVIKVADFGLSETLDVTKDYFRQGQDAHIKLPFKWMAPESMNDGVFSEKSDAWAYGVTLWEIYSGGKTPYSGIQMTELSRKLEDGYRMEKPRNAACTEDVYSMMVRCWETEPELRPPFAEMVETFSTQLLIMADYMACVQEEEGDNKALNGSKHEPNAESSV